MKRSASKPQTLKHLPFFEVLANAPEGSDEAKLATAGLLSLRMIDHWVMAGPAIVEPESVSVRSVRQAIMALHPKEPVRESLLTIVNTMQMLRHVDLIPVLPRVFAYAQLLERHHGALALASDAYESVIRLGDPENDTDVVMDAYERLAFCQRKIGSFETAVDSSKALVKLATRQKDHPRVLRAKIGLGLVSMMRGDLAEADTQFVAVAADAQRREHTREFASAMHGRAVVALRQGSAADAVILAHQSLKHTADPVARDRVLGDLAAALIVLEQFDAAIDALRILEVTSVSDEPRQTAKANLLAVAVRIGDEALFESARRDLETVASLPLEQRVNVLIESARGYELFGHSAKAEELLKVAAHEAGQHGLSRSINEIEELRRARPVVRIRATRPAFEDSGPAAEVANDLRRMAAALVTVS